MSHQNWVDNFYYKIYLSYASAVLSVLPYGVPPKNMRVHKLYNILQNVLANGTLDPRGWDMDFKVEDLKPRNKPQSHFSLD